MGLSLEFLLGEPHGIIGAVKEMELERLIDPAVVRRLADFSLHIIPNDLNLLSQAIGTSAGKDPIDLRPFMKVVLDEVDRGVLTVDPVWVSYVASASSDRVAEIAEIWAVSMQHKYNDPELIAAPEVRQAVEDLIELCNEAEREGGQVLHVWHV